MSEPEQHAGDEERQRPVDVGRRESLPVNGPVDLARQQLVGVVAEHVDPEADPEQDREAAGPQRDGAEFAERSVVPAVQEEADGGVQHAVSHVADHEAEHEREREED